MKNFVLVMQENRPPLAFESVAVARAFCRLANADHLFEYEVVEGPIKFVTDKAEAVELATEYRRELLAWAAKYDAALAAEMVGE